MSTAPKAVGDRSEPELYEIRIKGHLDDRWAEWFDGLTITRGTGGETLLRGALNDQAALHGVLRKIRDLGLPLLSVNTVGPGQASGPEGAIDSDHDRSNKETHQ